MSIEFTGMVLAAGFGKRMLPLTKELPKPLIDIHGITLLNNSINFLRKLGCNKICVNSHFKYQKIKDEIDKINNKQNIILIHEKEILDTAGGVKNAIKYSENKNFIVLNSDVFWRDENINSVNLLIDQYKKNFDPSLLLVSEKNAYGIKKQFGDFSLRKNLILRFKKGDTNYFYSGLQIFNTDIFKNFDQKKFSFNIVWDYLIDKKILRGKIMHSNWYHVGDIQGLNVVKKLQS